jgi:multidrug efflux pump subunit AcrA (membrane-fusion protein)
MMDSYKGEVFDAVVTKIFPIMNERTKTVKVEAGYVQAPPALYPNLTLEANIILQVKENALTLPRKFIINDLYVITTAGDTLPVKTGMKDYQKAEILDGIDETVKVILPN